MRTARGVRLRLLDAGDRDLYRALYTSPEVMQAIAPPLAIEAADAQFERVVRHNALEKPGHRAWRVECATDEAALGLVALHRMGERAEFGILLLPFAQRQGVAGAAIARLLPQAFCALDLEHIDASRPADAHAAVIDRMFAPFGFARVAGLRSGEIGWHLSKVAWTQGRGISVCPARRQPPDLPNG